MYLIFEGGKYRGQSTQYSHSDVESEKRIEVTETELRGMLGEDWQEKVPFLRLTDGEIAFDEEAHEQSLTEEG